ncbi:TATA-box-binding protein-like 1 [Panonychus citri]|uniref:TATA-box-binding protein-like 1 n=1 Tax=Panonychus citri TaxID=50023 RepID=UPI0023072489|nr:TATA-box-binding protein-like 1 [Panonychus citri]
MDYKTLSTEPEVVNVVISCILDKKLNPSDYGEYDPCKFSGIVLRDDKSCLLIYHSTKINITGVKSLLEAEQVIHRNLPDINIISSRIVNITATASILPEINFKDVYNNENFSWEPELFPGIIYRKRKHVATLFRSRKVNLTGFKAVEEIAPFFNEFLKSLPLI